MEAVILIAAVSETDVGCIQPLARRLFHRPWKEISVSTCSVDGETAGT